MKPKTHSNMTTINNMNSSTTTIPPGIFDLSSFSAGNDVEDCGLIKTFGDGYVGGDKYGVLVTTCNDGGGGGDDGGMITTESPIMFISNFVLFLALK